MTRRIARYALVVALLTAALLAALLAIPASRQHIRALVPPLWLAQFNAYRLGYRIDHDVKVTMPDGVTLGATLYLPRAQTEKLGTILIRLPYDRLRYKSFDAAQLFASNGYAVLVQDLRGKFSSGGEFAPYLSGTRDGAATLDWITQQAWSNGKVGTVGCSALGEVQYVLARARHPAHAAMIPLGAGGAMGSATGRYSYFGVYEGGVLQLATTFGWFLENGAKSPAATYTANVDIAAAVRRLPIASLVENVQAAPNGFREFVTTPFTDPRWEKYDYVADGDVIATPALVINTWGDQTIGDTLALAEFARKSVPPGRPFRQHVVIAPGKHCDHIDGAEAGRFGDLTIQNATQPYDTWYLKWFDYWLRGRGDGLKGMAPYTFYMIGENRWLTAGEWPPKETRAERWYLSSAGAASTGSGNGVLATSPPAAAAADEYRYDPMNPVPTRGGPICCTGSAADRAGPIDQADVEARNDVLVYTSAPLTSALRIAGPLRAVLDVSSSARDTDFVARLVHVSPDGRALGIQEGALRARYREGINKPKLLEPGVKTRVEIDMRSIAYTIPAGHRLRLHVTSSSFPRLERNLNTGGNNVDETVGVVAVNRVHHEGGDSSSYLALSRLPE
jgi:uncharacterized protein